MKKIMAGGSAPTGMVAKSILKGADSADTSQIESRRKKRNKSVGFVLEEGEAVAAKKTKTEDTPVSKKHESRIFRNSRLKKHKKNRFFKDHPVVDDMEPSPGTSSAPVPSKKLKRKAEKAKSKVQGIETNNNDNGQTKPDAVSGTNDTNNRQKLKKRKHQKKSTKMETEEPTQKIRKESTSEDELTAGLENMHIGSNPNNLIDLLDDMVPAGPKPYKPKRDRHTAPNPEVSTDANGNEFDLKKVVKWTKKRWNKDRKDASSESTLACQVVIQNLPVVMTSVYRQKLMELFQKFGPIKRIGPAEVQPSDDGEATFNTTIDFENEETAIKAQEEDNTRFAGSLIRVRRPLAPVDTTCVARSYTDLSVHMEELQEVFASAGNVRGICAAPRRGSGMALAFVKYDGPEAVQRALALSETVRINGKKLYVNKYEIRKKREQPSEQADST